MGKFRQICKITLSGLYMLEWVLGVKMHNYFVEVAGFLWNSRRCRHNLEKVDSYFQKCDNHLEIKFELGTWIFLLQAWNDYGRAPLTLQGAPCLSPWGDQPWPARYVPEPTHHSGCCRAGDPRHTTPASRADADRRQKIVLLWRQQPQARLWAHLQSLQPRRQGLPIFSGCSFARSFWAAIGWQPSNIAPKATLWGSTPPPHIHKRVLHPLLLLLTWHIWKHRNDVVFNSMESSIPCLVATCKEAVKDWACRIPAKDSNLKHCWSPMLIM